MEKIKKDKLTVRIPHDLVRYMQREAIAHQWSITKFAEIMIKRGLNDYKEAKSYEAREKAWETRFYRLKY